MALRSFHGCTTFCASSPASLQHTGLRCSSIHRNACVRRPHSSVPLSTPLVSPCTLNLAFLPLLPSASPRSQLAFFVARRTRFSRVTLSVPAVVIMIPGVPLYRALTYLNNQQIDDALAALFTVMFTIVAIGMGLALSRMLTDKNWLVEKQERVPNLWEYEEENA